jgi:hypothetical protein
MHRKLKLEAAARHLQQAFEASNGTLSYTQALDLLSELEGFEGYRQVRAFLGGEALKGEPTPKVGLPRQTLAMLLYGHHGYEGRKALPNSTCPIEGIKPLGMTYIGASSIPPSAHRLWVEDLEALMIAADWDAGERYFAALTDDAVIAKYVGTTGSHELTWKQIRDAQHVEGAVWSIDGVQYELLQYVPLEPRTFKAYEARDGEFMTRAEYMRLQKRLEQLDLSFAMGQELEGHFEEREQIVTRMDASEWTLHLDKGTVVFKSEYPERKAEVADFLDDSKPTSPREKRPVAVTLMDGTTTQWDFTPNISDCTGHLNHHDWVNKVAGHVLANDAALLEQLQEQMVDEATYIAAKDGKLGILMEFEYVSLESDGACHNADVNDQVPYQDRVAQLVRNHRPLEAQYPKVQFCVPEPRLVTYDRPAIWAFFENGALTREQRESLYKAMCDLAFGRTL